VKEVAGLIGAITPLIGLTVVVVLLVVYRRGVRRLFEGASRIRVGGVVDIEMMVATVAEGESKTIPQARLESVARQYDAVQSRLPGLRVLWVDDEPANNVAERQLLRHLGVVVQTALGTAEALDHLGRDDFDLILTDIGRADPDDSGTEMAVRIRRLDIRTPIVGYIGEVDQSRPHPAGFRALVDYPDDLLREVMNVAAARSETALH
jgi:CheY-like chemotaxis protein